VERKGWLVGFYKRLPLPLPLLILFYGVRVWHIMYICIYIYREWWSYNVCMSVYNSFIMYVNIRSHNKDNCFSNSKAVAVTVST